MKTTLFRFTLFLCLINLLGACGQSGRLYLPTHPSNTTTVNSAHD